MADVRAHASLDAVGMRDDERDADPVPLFVVDDVSDVDARSFALPSGTVTFLLTDIEGSSTRWDALPEAMARAVPRHYEILDECIARHGGVRPVEQGEGDSVVGAFSRASDGLRAALDAQRALASEPWPDGAMLRVRMALHTGEARTRDHGNYFGEAVIRCARLRDVGHGGQVLLSDTTAALVAGHLPIGASLIDLGMHRLKDLGRPERIWQLENPDLEASFPPLRSLDVFRHNLPTQLTPLIGRRRSVVDVCALFESGRLITLTGAGGVGKTRLALAVAAEQVESRPGGVWFVDLAAVTDVAAIARAALTAVGASELPGAPLSRQLAIELGDAGSLLVLDNCEHVVGECAELVATLLSMNASASVLATSREPLGVPGEITWRVPSLATPPRELPADIDTLSQYDAVRLFIDRARRARPSFDVDDANAPSLAQICQRLDGIPLAIELAAARCRQMPVQQVAAAIDDRFRLLTGGARTVMARQQTLAASVDWSHDQLADEERRTFRRLGVFAGAFSLEGAEAVVTAIDDVDSVAVFDLMSRLVDKSLVVADDAGPALRYRLLETLRVYALDRAREAQELKQLRDAHATWCIDWLSRIDALEPSDATVDAIEREHDNIMAALEWADAQQGLQLLALLGRPWQTSGRAGLALEHADRFLLDRELEERSPEAWIAAATPLAILYVQSGRYGDGFALIDRVEATAGTIGDDYRAGVMRWMRSGFAPEDSLAMLNGAERVGNQRWGHALATTMLAIYVTETSPTDATPFLAEADAAAAATGNAYQRELFRRAEVLRAAAAGDLAEAIALAHDFLSSRSTAVVTWGITALATFGLLARDAAAVGAAIDATDRARQKAPGMAPTHDIARHVADLLAGSDTSIPEELRTSDSWQGWTQRVFQQWILGREAIDAGGSDLAVDHARRMAAEAGHTRVLRTQQGLQVERVNETRPGPAAILAAIEAAARSDEERWHDALALAIDHGLRPIVVDALEGIAVAAARTESWSESLRLLTAADRLRQETGYWWRFRSEQQTVDDARSAAYAALGDNAEAAVAEGLSLEWNEAGAYARRARGERKRPSHGWASLTPTEVRVVDAVTEGQSNAEIGQHLMMSRSTVKTHLEHIFTKLGVRSRAELAAKWVRRSSE
jgi:predicted ATPase/class 3 adenylate cyclase/DNA-binding CsgD family transcriptional regulator